MHRRPLLSAEAGPRRSKPATCFCCRAEAPERELQKCSEPLREEWVACLTCARSGARPIPWPRNKGRG